MDGWSTISDVIQTLKSIQNPHALNETKEGKWISISSQEAFKKIQYLILALESLGVKKGDCVGIMSPPCIEWTLINFALLISGAVTVPLFPNLSEENFLFEVKETKTKIIFVRHLQPIPILDQHAGLFDKIIEMNSLEDLYKNGEEVAKQQPQRFEEYLRALKPDDLCTIIYTSATTGAPKGVMLSQKNLVGHMFDLPVKVNPVSRYLNIIPLAHIFGYTLNVLVFGWGGSVYYSADPKNFVTDSKEIHPTITAIVPTKADSRGCRRHKRQVRSARPTGLAEIGSPAR